MHVAVGGAEARGFHSASDPELIAGWRLEFDYNSDHLWGIYVGNVKFVMLNLAADVVEELSLQNTLNNSVSSHFDVDILYAPSVY